MNLKLLFVAFLSALVFFSCKKDDKNSPVAKQQCRIKSYTFKTTDYPSSTFNIAYDETGRTSIIYYAADSSTYKQFIYTDTSITIDFFEQGELFSEVVTILNSEGLPIHIKTDLEGHTDEFILAYKEDSVLDSVISTDTSIPEAYRVAGIYKWENGNAIQLIWWHGGITADYFMDRKPMEGDFIDIVRRLNMHGDMARPNAPYKLLLSLMHNENMMKSVSSYGNGPIDYIFNENGKIKSVGFYELGTAGYYYKYTYQYDCK